MSHYTVAVFSKTQPRYEKDEIDELLYPFMEYDGEADYPQKFLEFVEDEDADIDPETKKHGYWQNPNAKWDWWVVGGRWRNKLIDMGGKPCNWALVSDIDFPKMEKRARINLEPYDSCAERHFYKAEYFKKLYPTEESYIRSKTVFSTYAVITPDGVWHAPETMGWWCMDDIEPEDKARFRDEYAERFIKPAIENGWYMTIVDCHI